MISHYKLITLIRVMLTVVTTEPHWLTTETMQNIYWSKFEGAFLERPNGKSTNEESNKDGKSTLNMSSKKGDVHAILL